MLLIYISGDRRSRAERSRSPFAAKTETFQIQQEPQAGGNTVQWIVETVEKVCT
jgi:hypothetical protein